MATRQYIINTLITDLNNNFTVANGYTKVYEIRVGVFNPSELPSLPSAGVWITNDRVEEDLMDDTTFRRLELKLYSYVDSDMINDYDTFYQLISDFENFLYSTYNSLYKNTIIGDVNITYGGTSDHVGLFVINFEILYSQEGLES